MFKNKRIEELERRLRYLENKVIRQFDKTEVRYWQENARLRALTHTVLSTHSATDTNLEMLLEHLGLEVVHFEEEWRIETKESDCEQADAVEELSDLSALLETISNPDVLDQIRKRALDLKHGSDNSRAVGEFLMKCWHLKQQFAGGERK